MTSLVPPKLLWNQVPYYKFTSPQDKVSMTTTKKLEGALQWWCTTGLRKLPSAGIQRLLLELCLL